MSALRPSAEVPLKNEEGEGREGWREMEILADTHLTTRI